MHPWRASSISAILAVTLWMTACTYAPPEEPTTPINSHLTSDAQTLYIAVRVDSYREPTGLSRFPDGGRARVLSRELRVFRADLETGEISLLTRQPAPESAWTSFEPRIWSATGDEVIVLLTGCRQGGECYGEHLNREFYRLDRHGNWARRAGSEPMRNSPPGGRVTTTYPDRVEVLARFTGERLQRFDFDAEQGIFRQPEEELPQRSDQSPPPAPDPVR